MARRADFVVVGAGVIGLAVACELRRRHPDCSVRLVEKEEAPGLHASTRNSGVLHAGFYYSSDSLKARYCREGNAAWQAWCAERGILVRRCGKLVVTQSEEELPRLEELFRRGQANGVRLEYISAAEARAIEPRVRTHRHAIYSPTTATVEPHEVIESLVHEAERLGVETRCGQRYEDAAPEECGHLVNCAGLYADTIAHRSGFGQQFAILPFKGLYLYSNEPDGALRTNVYPVPDPAYPFLGVHFTVTVDGHTKIGPTAIPCLWREQYEGLEGFRLGELRDILGLQLSLAISSGFEFLSLAREELVKRFRHVLVGLASGLLDDVDPEDYREWGRPGIRAQLVDLARRTLAPDFVIEGDERSTHVLNAVSPAFTCALPFARSVCDRVEGCSAPPAEAPEQE